MRMRHLVMLGAVLAGAFSLVRLKDSTAAIMGDEVFLRLDALRTLLNTESAWKTLESMGDRMALWTIRAEVVPANPGETCLPLEPGSQAPERLTLRFEFGSQGRQSARVYALDFSGCKIAEETFQFQVVGAGFEFDPELDATPVSSDRIGLRVLRLALNDPQVFLDLSKLRSENRLVFFEIALEEKVSEGALTYRLTAADSLPRSREPSPVFSRSSLVVSYVAHYNEASDSATFEAGTSDD